MIATLLCTVTLLWGGQDPAAAGQAQPAVYTNEWIGISLRHPSDWKLVPKKTDAWISFPIQEGASRAAVYLVAAEYYADKEIWQKSQEHAARQIKADLVKQWEEEILGVPLLLTRIRNAPGTLTSALKAVPELPAEQPLVTVVGLVYSRTGRKLLFRLTAPESGFGEAEYAWRKVLETLRTEDGSLPKPEEPGRTPEAVPPPGKKPAAPPKVTPIGEAKPGGDGLVRAPNVFEATAANRKIGLYYPAGWKVVQENGVLTMSREAGGPSLRLSLHSSLDSDPPIRALLKASGQALAEFETVLNREENLPRKNRAGMHVVRIVRTGQGKEGPVWTFEAVGGSTEFYFLITAKSSGALDAAFRKDLEDLVETMSVEPMG